MNARSDRSIVKAVIGTRRKPRATKPSARSAQWESADERLDDALRQSFPASDALSIVQGIRCG